MHKYCPNDHLRLVFLTCLSLAPLSGCTELGDLSSPYPQDPYYRQPPGYDSYDRRERERNHQERHELEHERERLEAERRRLEDERRRESTYKPPAPPSPPAEHCPAGFQPREQRCSPDERRNGCHDIRLPGGLGCVRR